jgi:hypothetical protein
MMAEACAWIAGGRQPSYTFAYDKNVPSPWWHVAGRAPAPSWRGSRLGFSLSLMLDRVGYTYNPYGGNQDDAVNRENDFWLDAFSVCRDGIPPRYGASTQYSGDDDLVGQRRCNNWLGRPLAAARKTSQTGGTVWTREFANGIAVANASNADFVFTPGKPTQRITGRQDRQYDNGLACRAYLVPKGEGLVLIKQGYITPSARKPQRNVICRPPAARIGSASDPVGDVAIQ